MRTIEHILMFRHENIVIHPDSKKKKKCPFSFKILIIMIILYALKIRLIFLD